MLHLLKLPDQHAHRLTPPTKLSQHHLAITRATHLDPTRSEDQQAKGEQEHDPFITETKNRKKDMPEPAFTCSTTWSFLTIELAQKVTKTATHTGGDFNTDFQRGETLN